MTQGILLIKFSRRELLVTKLVFADCPSAIKSKYHRPSNIPAQKQYRSHTLSV